MTTWTTGGPPPNPGTMHLAARLPGFGGATAPAGGRRRPWLDFSSFEHPARTAERGLFDFLLLAEGPPTGGGTDPADGPAAAGGAEAITVLNALAAVTDRLGLTATVEAGFNEPFELARRLATLDLLSGGRAAWHVLASSDARAGENFRRGGPLPPAESRTRAEEFVATARELWDSWTPPSDRAPHGVPRPFAHAGRHFEIEGEFTAPRSPQGHPVLMRACDLGEGGPEEDRECAAATADVVLTRHSSRASARALYADLKSRLARHGRQPGDLKIMPRVSCVLGDTDTEARERAAAAPAPPSFAGTPSAVAEALDLRVRDRAADGFLLVPPCALDEFVDRVVPLLQERGAFRTAYAGTTLRAHLGLPEPVWKG